MKGEEERGGDKHHWKLDGVLKLQNKRFIQTNLLVVAAL